MHWHLYLVRIMSTVKPILLMTRLPCLPCRTIESRPFHQLFLTAADFESVVLETLDSFAPALDSRFGVPWRT